MSRVDKKRRRQELLARTVRENPFLKDDQLAQKLGVSVATVRLDRTELGIGEYRERIRNVAVYKKDASKDVGEVIDFDLYHNGTSVLSVFDAPTFPESNIIMGQALYSYAENLALSIINAKSALVRVANIKYLKPCIKTDCLIAKYEVMRVRDKEYVVWVKISNDLCEVSRVKLNLSVIEEK